MNNPLLISLLLIFICTVSGCKKHDNMCDIPKLLSISPVEAEMMYPEWKDSPGHWTPGGSVQFFYAPEDELWGGGMDVGGQDKNMLDEEFRQKEIATYSNEFETKEDFLRLFNLVGKMNYEGNRRGYVNEKINVGTYITHTYNWNYAGKNWTVQLDEYFYKNKKRYFLCGMILPIESKK